MNDESNRLDRPRSGELAGLRAQIVKVKRGQPVDLARLSAEDIQHLIHELQIHQAELETQNEALRQSEEKYRLLFNSGNDALFVYHLMPDNRPGKFIEVNDVACQRLGYSREELLQLSFLDIDSMAPEEIRPVFLRVRVPNLLARKHILIESEHVTKDGRAIPVEINAHLFDYKGQPTVLSIARDISKHKQTEEALRELNTLLEARATGLAALNDISAAVNKSSDLHTILRLALEQITTLTAADGAECHLVDDTGVLALTETWGLDEGFVAASLDFHFPAGEGIPGRAFADRVPVYVPDAPTDERYLRRDLARVAGYHSLLCVPIHKRRTPLGTFMLYSRQPCEYSSETQDLLVAISQQLTVAVERARLYDAQRRQAGELARSNALIAALSQVVARLQISLDPDETVETLGVELKRLGFSCQVAFLEPDTGELVIRYVSLASGALAKAERLAGLKARGFRLPPERSSIYAQIQEGRRVSFIANLSQIAGRMLPRFARPVLQQLLRLASITPDTRIINALLIARERTLGVLSVWGDDLREGDMRAISLFAGQVAAALEVARLHEQLKTRRVEEQQVMLRLSQALLAKTEAQAMMDLTVRQAAQALQVEIAAIALIEEDGLHYSGKAAVGWLPELYRQAQHVPMTANTGFSYAVRTHAPVIIPDEAQETRFGTPLWVTQMGITSSLLVPMLVAEKAIGGLIVNSRTPWEWSEDEVRLLSLIANTAAQALERAKLFTALQESEERYRSLFDNTPIGLFRTTPDGQFLDANLALLHIAGFPDRETLLQSDIISFYLNPEDRQRWQEQIAREGAMRDLEVQVRRYDGQIIWARSTLRAVRDDEEQALYYEGSVQDITRHKQAEDALRNVAQGVSAVTGDEFFASLVMYLARTLAVDYAFVGELAKDKEGYIETVAVSDRGELQTNYEFPLAGTPCENVVGKEPHYYPDIQLHFPRARLVTETDLKSYMGIPLWNSGGQPLGVLVMLHRDPLSDPQMAQSMLSIFAVRAAAELERRRAEEEQERLFEQVRAGRERLQALSHQLVSVQEAERRHLARELHDEIGQALTGLRVILEIADSVADDIGKVRSRLNQARSLVEGIMAQVHDLSLDLRPSMLDDLGLLPALLWLFERFTSQTGVRVAVEHNGLKNQRFSPDVETAAYRVVQEALTNVARHAGVNEVTARLWADRETLGLQVEDQGSGFDAAAAIAAGTSSGLSGMQERSSLLGGRFEVDSSPGGGTKVTAELPLLVIGKQ